MTYILGLLLVGSIGQLAFFAAGLFVLCMVCHGELAAMKPPPHHLTSFYLTVALGGAAGTLLAAAGAGPLGAAERGAEKTEGIHADLIRRLTVAARFAPADDQLPAEFLDAYREGFDAGRESG